MVFVINLKKLFAEAPEIKMLIKNRALNEKIRFRESSLNRQLFVERLKRDLQSEPSLLAERKEAPFLTIPMLIDPNTLEV